jgi:hypothetical protein
MSIQQVQIKNLLELITETFLANGINPTDEQVHGLLSAFFSKHPAGNPVTIEKSIFATDAKSDTDVVNDLMASVVFNLDTLYETSLDQVDQVLTLNSILNAHLERLKIKRKVLENRIDDYLLGIYNSDGYFYSKSDDLSSTGEIDLALSTVYVDVDPGVAMLSPISSLSRTFPSKYIAGATIRIVDENNRTVAFTKQTDFNNAKDGLSNTSWYVEAKTESNKLIATITIPISGVNHKLTKLDITPHGAKPVQCGVNARFINENGSIGAVKAFSDSVLTSSDKMTFMADYPDKYIDQIVIQMIKSEPDYTLNTKNSKTNVFLFGLREIAAIEQYYEQNGTFVSKAFGIPDALKADAVIDAVSLVVDDSIPANTEIKYFIAEDNPDAVSLSDFAWRDIEPISGINETGNTVIRFDGSTSQSPMIRREKENETDIKMVPEGSLNPRQDYIAGVDVYRLCPFKDEFLSNTLKLEEGINTTRIYFLAQDTASLADGFTFWNETLNETSPTYDIEYGEINSGHGFFWGGTIAENNRSVFVETFVHCERDFDVFLKQCRKSDENSKLWSLRLFLNGREIANMPVGTDVLNVPWRFRKGKNHIVLMVDIPNTTNAYSGSFDIMVGDQLGNYGLVKLDDWTYVDFYKLSNNHINDAKVFTIYNEEIISRRKPTDNFRLSYKKKTSAGPEYIRFRADLSRLSNNANISPVLDLYRVRFSYS